jgi:hypothetical protein
MLLKAIEQMSKFDVPVGSYRAKLVGYKEMPPSQQFPDSKPSWAWEFEVAEGEHAGKITSRFTPQTLTTGNGLGKMLGEMLGRKIIGGEDIDVQKLIGKTYQITVGFNKTGTKTRVILCMPANSSAPTVPSVPPPPPAPKQATLGNQAPTTYMVSIAGKTKVMDAMEAQQMLSDGKFTANDFVLDGQTWKAPQEVIYPF